MTDERTNRANAVANELADHLNEAMARIVEISDMDVSPTIVVEMLKQRKFELPPDANGRLFQFAYAMMGQKPPTPSAEEAIRAQLEELFREAPAPIAGSSAAIPDVAIVLRSFPQPISGVLTKCASGLLKLGAMSPGDRNTPAGLIEHFFAYEEILAIVVRREVKAAAPVIFSSH